MSPTALLQPTHPLLKTILKLNKLTAKRNSPDKTAQTPSSAADDKELITIDSDDDDEQERSESRPNNIIKGILSKPPPLVPFSNVKPTTTTTTDNNCYFGHPAPAKDDRTCSYCRRTFKFPSVLRLHLAAGCCVYKHLGGGGTPSAPEDQEAAEKSSQTCSICFKYFLDPENLKKHLALHAINHNTGSPAPAGPGASAAQVGLSCEFCLKTFRNSILLSQHLKESHDSAKPYNCSHCPGKFNTIHACNLHVQVVHSKQQAQQTSASAAAQIAAEYEEFVANASAVNNLPISFLHGTTTSASAAGVTTTGAGPRADTGGDNNSSTLYNTCTSYLVCELCSTICLNRMELISHRHIVHRISTPPVSSNTTSNNIQELCSNIPQYSKQPAVQLVAGQAQHPPQIPLSPPPSRNPRDNEENPKKYKCKHCPKILHSQKGKLLHERLKHKHLTASNNSSPGNNPLVGQSAPWGIGTGGVKCRFCSLWYSNVAIRAIHEKRAHSNELGSWAAKEHAILERKSSRDETKEAAVVADGAEWMEEVDEVEDESDPLAPNSGGGEEIQVDVKPSYLTEYMDESGGGASGSGSGGQDDYTDLLSHPVPIPLQTSLLNTGPLPVSSSSGSEPASNSYYCQFCTKPFIAFVNLAIHLDEHDYCATCEKKFSSQSRYRQHLLSDHDRVPKLFCQICCAEFNELEPFVEHCMAVHGGESGGDGTSSNEAGSRLTSAAAANQRRSEPTPAIPPSTTCTKCNLTFASVNMLQRHTNIAHIGIDDHEPGNKSGSGRAGGLGRNYGGQQGQTTTASGSGSAFTCHLCNKNLLTSAALLKHKIFVHNYSGVNTPASEHATLNRTSAHNFINENDDECIIIEDEEEPTTSSSTTTATVSTTKQSQIVYPQPQAQVTQQTYNPTTFNPNLNTLVVPPFQHHQAQSTVTTTTRMNQPCTYKCSKCYITFGNVEALREHFKLHHGMTMGHNSTLAVATATSKGTTGFDDHYSSFIDGLGREEGNDDCDSILS